MSTCMKDCNGCPSKGALCKQIKGVGMISDEEQGAIPVFVRFVRYIHHIYIYARMCVCVFTRGIL